MITSRPYSRRCTVAFLALLVLIVLFPGLGIYKVGAQSEINPPKPAEVTTDLFNWSWSYEMFGYMANASLSLKRVTPDTQSKPQEETAPSSEQHKL